MDKKKYEEFLEEEYGCVEISLRLRYGEYGSGDPVASEGYGKGCIRLLDVDNHEEYLNIEYVIYEDFFAADGESGDAENAYNACDQKNNENGVYIPMVYSSFNTVNENALIEKDFPIEMLGNLLIHFIEESISRNFINMVKTNVKKTHSIYFAIDLTNEKLKKYALNLNMNYLKENSLIEFENIKLKSFSVEEYPDKENGVLLAMSFDVTQ